MELAELLLILGAAIVLLGLLGTKVIPTLAKRRRWILMVGVVILALGAAFGVPDMVRGFRDGFRDAGR